MGLLIKEIMAEQDWLDAFFEEMLRRNYKSAYNKDFNAARVEEV